MNRFLIKLNMLKEMHIGLKQIFTKVHQNSPISHLPLKMTFRLGLNKIIMPNSLLSDK